jgi:ribonuclease R
LTRVGEHSSQRERIAEEAERETVKIKQAVYLSKHVGDVFEGIISGIASFGFFVRLTRFSAEGVVRLSTLTDDYYQVDENRFNIAGVHTGNSFSLGEKVSVQIVNVDLDRYQINLRVVGDSLPGGRRANKRKIARRKRRR